MNEIVVLDTSVVLADFNALHAFPNTTVIIPITVINELDTKKTRNDEIGRNARETIRILDDLRKKGSLASGVEIEDNQSVIIVFPEKSPHKSKSEFLNNDDKIINIALWLKEKEKEKSVVLISQDILLRVKAGSVDLNCREYFELDHGIEKKEEIYNGIAEIIVNQEIIDKFYKDKEITIDNTTFFPNQFVVLISNINKKQTALGISRDGKKIEKFKEIKEVYELKPKNREQQFALQLLMNKDISLVTLMGAAGVGKSLLALAAALQQVEDGIYDRLIVTKPMVPIGKHGDVGFLPGDLISKLMPWNKNIFDNLRFLAVSDHILDDMMERGKIEIEALSLFRGRSIPRSIVFCDETQNFTKIEAKTLVTRIGYDSKVIMAADNSQIDSVYVDTLSNGAVHVVEKMKALDFTGHVTLVKGERSKLATIASEIL